MIMASVIQQLWRPHFAFDELVYVKQWKTVAYL